MFENLFGNVWFWVVAAYVLLAIWSATEWFQVFRADESEALYTAPFCGAVKCVSFAAIAYPKLIFSLIFGKGEAWKLREATPIFGWYWRRKYRREDEEETRQRRISERDERDRQRWEESERRTRARRQWLEDHKLTLYFTTKDGITAVMRPVDYEACRRETYWAIRNELWPHEGLLMPSDKTFLFVTERGRQLLDRNLQQYAFAWAAGWMTDLDAVTCGRIVVEEKKDIFVPWTSESLLSFDQHKCYRSRSFPFSLEFLLTEGQAPAEMQPL